MSHDWQSEPQMVALREEFIHSFETRRALLASARDSFAKASSDSDRIQALKEVLKVAHKLAGVAELYGFSTLTEYGAAYEEGWAGLLEQGRVDFALFEEEAHLLDLLLECASTTRSDPLKMKNDTRYDRVLKRVTELETE